MFQYQHSGHPVGGDQAAVGRVEKGPCSKVGIFDAARATLNARMHLCHQHRSLGARSRGVPRSWSCRRLLAHPTKQHQFLIGRRQWKVFTSITSTSEARSSVFACTISAPSFANAFEASPLGLRAMPRICHPALRHALATAPPWMPVEPSTAIVRVIFMLLCGPKMNGKNVATCCNCKTPWPYLYTRPEELLEFRFQYCTVMH